MKVLQVHNRYRVYGGEDSSFDGLVALLRARGVDVATFTKDSRDLGEGWGARVRASVVFSRRSAREMTAELDRHRPDVVHVHNLFPLLTPSVLVACRERGVPVVMTCHNYRLVCAVGTHFRDGALCTLCTPGNEHWCAIKNCRGSWPESAAYALRTAIAQRFGLFRDTVSRFIVLSEFQGRQIAAAGIAPPAISVLPNAAPATRLAARPSTGGYAAFAGRVCAEKGIPTLLEAARRVPHVAIRIAGDSAGMPGIEATASPNVTFVGPVSHDAVDRFFAGARCAVVPSVAYEGCPMVILEASSTGLPVVATRLGGLPELVECGVTGLLFAPGDAGALAACLDRLWSTPRLADRLGAAARQRMIDAYNEDLFFDRLAAIYRRAIEDAGGRVQRPRSVA